MGIFSLQTIELIEIPKAFVEASIYSFKEGQIVTETIELAILMTLIFVLAKCMQETGDICPGQMYARNRSDKKTNR